MPLQTDLSTSPYYDDFEATKNFGKILFKPGVAVQTRELNQLQTLLQTQVERFGDNIFKRGTIVDGAQFSFYDDYPFVKLNDADSSGEAINVTDYVGLFVTDETNGTSARIINTVSGFEGTTPDLNTLYVSYTRSGSSGELTFEPNASLIVTDLDRGINAIEVLTNVSGFSNNDVVVISPALAIQNSIGGTAFSNGAAITDIFTPGLVVTQNLADGQAKAVIVSANSTFQNNAVILTVRPLTNSLTGNSYSNGLYLVQNSFQANATVPIVANSAELYISAVIGTNAASEVTVSTSGRIVAGMNSLTITSSGSGYTYRPHVTVASGTANTTQVDSLQITARNYYARVSVANSSHTPIGSGYAFGITEAVIYQKGYFSRVEPQTVIVEKYRTVADGHPTQKVIGFDTIESVVNSNTDYTLLDNANTGNAVAPGADRLKLSPTLTVISTDELAANTEFFSIVEFAKGNPFKQIRDPKYNAIESSMAQRTFEQTGDFVLDQFLVNTVSEANSLLDAATFNIVVDPGTAYIAGRRVTTSNNYVVSVPKGVSTVVSKNVNIDVNLGNYIDVVELAGTFPTSKMVKIDLYDTEANYYAGTIGTEAASAGAKIGEARIRGVTSIDGTPGTPEARYRIYLFDVVMLAGKNFSSVRSIFYDGTNNNAVADVYGTAVLRETSNNYLVFPTRFGAIKTLSSANIEFRSRTTTINAAANGLSSSATMVISAGPNAYFPYVGTLTDNEMRDIIITPTTAVRSNTNITGTITGTLSANVVTGTGTAFVTELYSGAYLRVNGQTRRVTSVTNNTYLSIAGTIGTAFAANVAQIELPAHAPVALADIPGASASVSSNTQLTISSGFVSQLAAWNAHISFDVVKNQSSSTAAKTTKRRAYVKIQANTHPESIRGPWCLGIPDAFRLRGVYRSTGTVTTSSENITEGFYLDNNQNENYLDLSYLMIKPGSKFDVESDDLLLVEFDVFQNPADRPFTIDSYNVNDTIEVAVANSTVHTAEVPQFYSIKGTYHDLRDCIDFRPTVVATANVLAPAASATVNPAETRVIDETLDKNIPAPQGDLKFSVEAYEGRADRVIMTSNGDIRVLSGYPGSSYTPMLQPADAITLDILNIPPYPSVPKTLNEKIALQYNTYMGSERLLTARTGKYTIRSSPRYQLTNSQNRRYSMADIAKMDRRLNNVEQAVSLTLVEQDLNNLVIPSSLDSTPRFKFGFAVDNFEGLRLTDTTNPQFNASIFEGRLSPLKKRLVVSYVESTGLKLITLPRASDFKLIDQDIATDGPVILPEPPLPPMPVDPVKPTPPPTPPSPPRPPITLETEGDVAHVCGLVPGTVVEITVRHPLTRDIYMQVERTADDQGCVEAPLIFFPPPPPPPPTPVDPKTNPDDPIICWPPTDENTPPVIVVTPQPPVPPVTPPPPVVVTPVPDPYNPPYRGGGGGGGGGPHTETSRTDLFDWLATRGNLDGTASDSIERALGVIGY